MTWATTIGTGRGSIRARLQIEGLAYEAVTHADMVTTAGDGRQRINGLNLQGVKLEQRADIVRATVEASGATFVFADVGGAWTAAFDTSPTLTTWLNTAMTATASTMRVKSTAGWPTSGTLWIDSETCTYAGVGAGATFTGLTRGVWGSLAQSHYTPGGAFLRYPAVTNQPILYTGRRVRLYLYGRGDSPTGDGTQVWLGVVRGEPRMEGASWSLFVDPISSILDQEVGADLGPAVTPRGIYFPESPFRDDGKVTIARVNRIAYTSGGSTTLPDVALFGAAVDIDAGHYETQQDLLDAIQASLDALQSSWNTKIYVLPRDLDGTYMFQYRTNGTPDGVRISSGSVEPAIATEPYYDGNVQGSNDVYDADAFRVITAMSSNAVYYTLPQPPELGNSRAGAGLVPRGVFNVRERTGTYPGRRIYLGGAVGVTNNTSAVLISWQGDTGSVDLEYGVNSIGTSTRYLDLQTETPPSSREGLTFVYTPANLPTIRLGRGYNTYPGEGSYSLLKTIEDDCPEQVNTGAVPSFQATDWNESEWQDAYDGADTLALQRRYSSLKPVKLTDFVAPDLQIAGLYLAFDTSGKLTAKRMRLAASTEAGTFAITRANLLTDDGFPTYERGAVGQYNGIELHEGYSATSDDYTQLPITVRDVAAYGQSPIARSVKIEPKSAYMFGAASYESVVAIAERVLSIYGGPYAYITCAVPLTAFDVVLGSTVSISTAQLPSGAGTRGTTDAVGLVVSREIDLYAGRITLTILVSRSAIVGYAFGAKITGQTNTTGNTWAITVSSDYFATGEDASDHVDASDRVQVYRWDDATADTALGTVTGVSANVVTVTFDGTWTPGSDAWALAFADADAGSDTDNMRRYAYQATSTARVEWAVGADTPARVLA